MYIFLKLNKIIYYYYYYYYYATKPLVPFLFIAMSYVKVFVNETCLFWSCWHFCGILARVWLFLGGISSPHFFCDSSLSEFSVFSFFIPVKAVFFLDLENIIYMMTPCCYNYQNPSEFWKEYCRRFNVTKVSNLSVKGRGIWFVK